MPEAAIDAIRTPIVEAVSRFPPHPPSDPHPQLGGGDVPMGLPAESVAQRCNVSREARDDWAKPSQDRAVAARDGTFGLATMCVAGGMGQAMIVERLH